MDEHSTPEATAFALKLLSLRNHSRFELAGKLQKKGYSPQTAEAALECLNERKLLDDAAFARELIESRRRRKPAGRAILQYDLLQRGIPESVATELLKDYDSLEAARRAGRKKLASLKGRDANERKKRIEVFLRNRGFEWPVIKETLESLFTTGPECGEDQSTSA